jgi:hypothetical protein
MKDFWRWTFYGIKVCIFISILVTVIFFSFRIGSYVLSDFYIKHLPTQEQVDYVFKMRGIEKKSFNYIWEQDNVRRSLTKYEKPFWTIPLGILVYALGAGLSFGIIRQVIIEIKRYPKPFSEMQAGLLSQVKWNRFEIVGIIFVFGSVLSSYLQSSGQRWSDTALSLFFNCIFSPAMVIGLILLLYGRAKKTP